MAKYKYRILDKSLKTPEERTQLVTTICEETPPEFLTPYYCTTLADYILDALPKKEKLSHYITTKYRQVTLNKRETSYQGMAEKLEGGEDSLYNLISDYGKEQYLDNKENEPFPQELLNESAELRELREAIDDVLRQLATATGVRRSALRRQLIEMRQQQYDIRASYIKPYRTTSITRSFAQLDLNETITVNADGSLTTNGLCSMLNPKHVAAVLSNYENLQQHSYGKFNSDSWYFMMDFTKLFEQDFKAANPMYYDIARMKIDGCSNAEIRTMLDNKYHIVHSIEYISTLWTKKIPAAVAALAEEQYIDWYFTYKVKGTYKKCNRCGQIKLALPRYFSKNSSSKDGLYSICKDCRNNKGGDK